MAILNIQTMQPPGLVGVNPSVIYILTNDTYSAVTTTGYLNPAKQMGFYFNATQTALVYTTDRGNVVLNVSITSNGAVVSLVSQSIPTPPPSDTWVTQTTSSATMDANTGYTADAGASLISFTLPTTSSIGDFVEINGKSSGLWRIIQSAGQQIFASPFNTTFGAGGSLSSVNRYDCVRLRCVAANASWVVVSQQSTGLIYV